MPGPWIHAPGDPDYFWKNAPNEKLLVEFKVYDDAAFPQGTVVGYIERNVGETRHGYLYNIKFLGCSDTYYAHWMEHAGYEDPGIYHFTTQDPKGSRVFRQGRKQFMNIYDYRELAIKDCFSGDLVWLGDKRLPGVQQRIKDFLKCKGVSTDEVPSTGVEIRQSKPTEGIPEHGTAAAPRLFSEADAGSGSGPRVAEELRKLERSLTRPEVARGERSPTGKEERKKETRRSKDGPFAGATSSGGDGDKVAPRDRSPKRKRRRSGSSNGGDKVATRDRTPKRKRQRSRSSSRSTDSCRSSSSGFRIASRSASRSSQLKLFEYARRKPGRLAQHLLQKMEELVLVEGEGENKQGRTPPVSKAYVLRILMTKFPDMSLRNKQELRTLTTIMDLICRKKPDQAMDVLAQRLKAIEVVLEGSTWDHAKYIELVSEDSNTVISKDERHLMAHETRANRDLQNSQGPAGNRSYKSSGKGTKSSNWVQDYWDQTGQVQGKGKQSYGPMEPASNQSPNQDLPTKGSRKGKKSTKGKWW